MSEVNPNYNPLVGGGKSMMDISDYTLTVSSIKKPTYVGGYRLGKDTYHTQINFTHKPNWFHRTMMRLCFGWEWVNL